MCTWNAFGLCFRTGWSYQAIVDSLQPQHGISMSLRTLKRRLSEYALTKKGNCSARRVRSIIHSEIQGPSYFSQS